jgi:TonB-linked SusC/RagA family outer membrane protein
MKPKRFTAHWVFKCFTTPIPLIFFVILSHAQTVVSGTVTNENKESLQNVSVVEKGTSNGTTTDANGRFRLPVAGKNAILVFSIIGFDEQQTPVGNKTNFSITLISTVNSLGNVVVVGYGTVKKTDLTGAVSSIKAADFSNAQTTSIDQALQGRAAGVQVTNSDPTPGAQPNIRIRGTNSLGTSSEPLFVIDGYPSTEDISSINPDDVESIEILKDASATAIYGSRGANGVVMITTKRGAQGKFLINFSASSGMASAIKKLDLMNARQYAEYRNDVIKNTNPGTLPFASEAVLGYLSTHTTNWQDAIFRSAPLSNFQLSMSGGDDKTRWLLSGGWFKQDGIIINSDFQRANLRFNFDRQITPRFKFGLTSLLGHTSANHSNTVPTGITTGATVLQALAMNPATPVYDSSGNYTYQNTVVTDNQSSAQISDVWQIGNPVAYSKRAVNINYLNHIQQTVFGEYEIITGLKLRVLFGGEYLNNWNNSYIPYELFEESFDHGNAARYSEVRWNWINESNITYTKNFTAHHSITALVGTSYQKFHDEYTQTIATGFFTNAFSFNNLGAATAVGANSSTSENQLVSFYGRVNAKLWDNLLLTATIRADGSSKFGENHKYGYFPSGAVAYKLGEEKFIKNLNIISELKLRVGYGITGNQEIAPYLSQFGYALASAPNSSGGPDGNVTFGSTRQVGIAANRPANPNLQWEQTASYNGGVDVGLWSNRLSLTVDYYKKTTTHLLWDVALPSTTGFLTAYENLGEIQNNGVELAILGKPVNTKKFAWSSSFNIAFNKTKVVNIGDEASRLYGVQLGLLPFLARDNFILIKPGEPIGLFYGYLFDGIWQSQKEIDNSSFSSDYKRTQRPGMPKYKDLNGDGVIDGNDRTGLGSAYPKAVFGFTNTFSYKGFQLSIFLQGQTGNKVLNLDRYVTEVDVTSNKSTDVLKRWTGEGTSNTITAAGYEINRFIDNSLVENGSYLRLKSLTLGYQFSNQSGFLKSAKIRSFEFYVTGTNLLTWTKYRGYDPEVGTYNYNLFGQGIDQGSYVVSHSIIIGLKLGL